MDLLRKLIGKKTEEYELAAKILVSTPNIRLFKELVAKDDFLFGYIKQNAAKRIFNACNETNYKNLYEFLPYYSPFYDDVIVSVLSKYDKSYADKKMTELLCVGSLDEKCYAAKYFELNPQLGCASILRGYIFSDNEYLSANSIDALKKLDDEAAFNLGLEKLKSNDDYEVYSGVKIISKWGKPEYLINLFESMKNSSIPEYIALEINNLKPLAETVEGDFAEQTALALCHILSGLGEIIPLDTVFEINAKEIFEKLAVSRESSAAIVLAIAKDLFGEFAGNDEYLFDLDKNTKDEIININNILLSVPKFFIESGIIEESYAESPFIDFIIKYITDEQTLVALLEDGNQTVVLSALEHLKALSLLNNNYKQIALKSVTNENIKSVINAL